MNFMNVTSETISTHCIALLLKRRKENGNKETGTIGTTCNFYLGHSLNQLYSLIRVFSGSFRKSAVIINGD